MMDRSLMRLVRISCLGVLCLGVLCLGVLGVFAREDCLGVECLDVDWCRGVDFGVWERELIFR